MVDKYPTFNLKKKYNFSTINIVFLLQINAIAKNIVKNGVIVFVNFYN